MDGTKDDFYGINAVRACAPSGGAKNFKLYSEACYVQKRNDVTTSGRCGLGETHQGFIIPI